MEPSPLPPPAPIGLFDSGVGGLSVLRALHALAPHAELLYVADSGHAPYGERDDAFVQQRSLGIARFLRAQGVQVLVVACNTATASAVAPLRQAHADLPIVGVEPGIKPAVAQSRSGRIGVLATEGTLRSDKFRRLMQSHAGRAQLHLQPCPGLAHAIEQGDPDAAPVRELVARFCAPLRAQQVDTVVLGCTHYAFAAHHIQAELGPDVSLVDTAGAVARRALAQCGPAAVAPTGAGPRAAACRLWTTGDPAMLAHIARCWLPFDVSVASLPAGASVE
jgi:glutamate racemase